MTQVGVNGILVNAIELHDTNLEVDYQHAECILTTVPNLPFEIFVPGTYEALSLESLVRLKETTDVKFEIREIDEILDEAGKACPRGSETKK